MNRVTCICIPGALLVASLVSFSSTALAGGKGKHHHGDRYGKRVYVHERRDYNVERYRNHRHYRDRRHDHKYHRGHGKPHKHHGRHPVHGHYGGPVLVFDPNLSRYTALPPRPLDRHAYHHDWERCSRVHVEAHRGYAGVSFGIWIP